MMYQHLFRASSSLPLLCLALSLTFQVIASQCLPGQNCNLPDCRCWNDPTAPGNIGVDDRPQMVLVSFSYAVTGNNEGMYTSIFENVKNPNGCAGKGTFFVQETGSELGVIKTLHERKFEIGVTSKDGTVPTGTDWNKALEDVKVKLEGQGIPPGDILGVRAPSLEIGGDDQFESMKASQLVYDSSCTTKEYMTTANLLWPYTYDFVDNTPKCTVGKVPEKPFPGAWQFLVADLKFKDQICPTPSSCSPFFNSSQEAFDFLFNAFAEHYEGSRTPFVLYLDPLWLTVDYQKEATRDFLEFVRAAFDDTWVITNKQALAWMKDPTPNSKTNDFDPWKC